jgi:hypothetical protein
MEEVLDVYHRPYDPHRPVVCFDEQSKQLLETPHGQIDVRSGCALREDYEYQRNGTCNLFLWVEPLAGRRHVAATERRTKADFAEQIRDIVDVHYPDADVIVLVMDNLNTHNPGALYERFAPEEAHRINNKLEWHFTPEHASWLNMAEIELSVLSRQCLNGRIPNIAAVRERLSGWLQNRNQTATKINWQFTATNARLKLRRLYPTASNESGLS